MVPLEAPQSIPAKRKSDADGGPPRKRQTLRVGSLGVQTYWSVQWRHPQIKKHKTWEGDGIIIVEGTKITLFDTEGKSLGTGTNNLGRALQTDDELHVGGKDVLLDCTVDSSDFNAGRCFGNGGVPTESPAVSKSRPPASRFKPPIPKQGVHIPLQPINLYQPPERNIRYPSSEKREDVTSIFKNETPMGEIFKGTCDTNDPGKAEKVDPTTEALWEVEWRKPSTKKNKTWEGDGLLHQKGSVVRFFSEDGSKLLGSRTYDHPLRAGTTLSMSEKELQVQRELPLSRLDNRATEKEIQIVDEDRENSPIEILRAPNFSRDSQSRMHKFVPPKIMRPQVRAPDASGTTSKVEGPLYDPDAEGAIVMKAPSASHQTRFNPQNKPVVPVVIDPLLGRKLRPHQIKGVKFMYECVMGMAKHEGNGCILADAMGLGKTLQTIALIWTLLKQNPYSGKGPIIGRALIVCPVSLINNWKAEFHKWIGRGRIGVMTGDQEKARIRQFIYAKNLQVLIIGYEKLRSVINELAYCQPAIGLIVCDEGHRLKSAGNKTSKMFEALKTRRRIILSGTPIQNNLSEFHSMADFCNPGLMDEYTTFKRVYETSILLARAPDASPRMRELGEARAEQLQTVARSFVLRREATILGNYLPPKFDFVVFVSPTRLQLAILSKILSKDAVNKLAHSSTAKSLAAIGSLMKLCNSPMLLMKNGQREKQDDLEDDLKSDAISQAITCIPKEAKFADVSLSGKLIVLANILRILHKTTDEKCVIVSHYTSTLNIIEQFCNKKKYLLYRLDGQTPAHRRQEYVDSFNKSPQEQRFVFLLSTKAGGVGLNLIGASRLILVDSDWNPSHDLQAMARIHRDGQKRPVYIYRLLTTGTIDEKIFQRQITKIGLSEAMMGSTSTEGKRKSCTDSFTHKELRDLFTFDPNTGCGTHDLLQCPCEAHKRDSPEVDAGDGTAEEDGEDEGAETAHGENGRVHMFVDMDSSDSEPDMGFVSATQVRPDKYEKAHQKRRKEALAALGEWTHINCLRASAADEIQDEILGKVLYVPETERQGQAPQLDFDTTAAEVDRTLQALEAGDFSELCNDSEPAEKMYELSDLPGGSVTYVFEKASRSSL